VDAINVSFWLIIQKCVISDELQESSCIVCSVAQRWEDHRALCLLASVTLHSC